MSKAASLSRSSSPSKAMGKTKTKGFLPDRIVGGLAVGLDAFALVLLVMFVHGQRWSLSHVKTIDAFVLGLGLISHVGVFRGARWGFLLAAGLAAWGLVDSGVPAGYRVVLSTNLCMLAYAAFRLGSVYGPKVG